MCVCAKCKAHFRFPSVNNSCRNSSYFDTQAYISLIQNQKRRIIVISTKSISIPSSHINLKIKKQEKIYKKKQQRTFNVTQWKANIQLFAEFVIRLVCVELR